MTGIIKMNGQNSAMVGNLQVFTYEGAIKAYQLFCQIFNKEMTMEASAILSDASLDLHRLGFSWEEIERFEIETFA